MVFLSNFLQWNWKRFKLQAKCNETHTHTHFLSLKPSLFLSGCKSQSDPFIPHSSQHWSGHKLAVAMTHAGHLVKVLVYQTGGEAADWLDREEKKLHESLHETLFCLSLQFFRSVQSTCTELLKVIERYQDRITREWRTKLDLSYDKNRNYSFQTW